MYSLLCALVASTLTYAAIVIPLKNEWYGVLPATVVLVLTYVLLAKKHGKAVEKLVPLAMAEVKQQRVDNAVRLLQGAYGSAKWVFLMRSQIDGLIGQLHYMQKNFEEARPMLEKAMGRDSVSKGMLAAYWFRKHKPEESFKVLDNAIASNKKDAMLYGMKAWFKVRLKDRDGARSVLTTGKKNTKGNAVITENLVRLQNGEDLRMWEFGEHWWNFHLEKPSQKTLMKLSGQGNATMKGARKSMYR
jgi:predicted Zn-dependent protease